MSELPRRIPGHGRRLSLSRSRALVSDLLYQQQGMPNCTHERVFNLAPLVEERARAAVRISWPALFARSYGLVSQRFPVLRQCYMRWPWAHVYEYSYSIANITVSRSYRGEDWLFFGRLLAPEKKSLLELQQEITAYSTEPVDKVFYLQVVHSAFPASLRRLVWWIAFNLIGQRRARRFGTFGQTTISSRNAIITQPPNILTSTLSYGPLDEQGRCHVVITYDHRLLDGLTIADILANLEQTLQTEMVAELAAITSANNAEQAA